MNEVTPFADLDALAMAFGCDGGDALPLKQFADIPRTSAGCLQFLDDLGRVGEERLKVGGCHILGLPIHFFLALGYGLIDSLLELDLQGCLGGGVHVWGNTGEELLTELIDDLALVENWQ